MEMWCSTISDLMNKHSTPGVISANISAVSRAPLYESRQRAENNVKVRVGPVRVVTEILGKDRTESGFILGHETWPFVEHIPKPPRWYRLHVSNIAVAARP